jgi:hypothetical protein
VPSVISTTVLNNPAADSSMGPVTCPLCERPNPAASRFCNACGAPLPLIPCARCGAVNDRAAKTCYQCAAALPQAGVVGASGGAHAGARVADDRPEPITWPKPPADAPDREADLLASLQAMHRVLVATDSAHAGSRPDPGGQGGGQADPPSRAVVTLTAEHERFDPGPVELAASGAGSRGTRWRAVAVAGGAALALVAAIWYGLGFHRAPPAPAVPGTSGVVTDGAGAPAPARPVDPPADRTAAPPAAVPAPTGSRAVAPDGKAIPPASRSGLATGRPDAPIAEVPRPAPADASPASPPRPTAAVRVPAEKPAVVPTPKAPAGTRARAGGDLAPGILERQPPYAGQCTDGAAALGLCTPVPTQRRE